MRAELRKAGWSAIFLTRSPWMWLMRRQVTAWAAWLKTKSWLQACLLVVGPSRRLPAAGSALEAAAAAAVVVVANKTARVVTVTAVAAAVAAAETTVGQTDTEQTAPALAAAAVHCIEHGRTAATYPAASRGNVSAHVRLQQHRSWRQQSPCARAERQWLVLPWSRGLTAKGRSQMGSRACLRHRCCHCCPWTDL